MQRSVRLRALKIMDDRNCAGTLFGAGAQGGVIRYITNKANLQFIPAETITKSRVIGLQLNCKV
jgi:hypothetical protein